VAKEDDDAWRAIVDNYGDRPELEEPAPAPPDPGSSDFVVDAPVEDERTWDDPDTDWETDRFVPPPPPPVPTTTFDRQAAWAPRPASSVPRCWPARPAGRARRAQP
jgi:hypothetical protein